MQQAVRLVIEPIFEAGFAEGSYGFRPGRGCHDALREVDRLIKEGFTHVVDADLASYFDTIPHDALVARVEVKTSITIPRIAVATITSTSVMPRSSRNFARVLRRSTARNIVITQPTVADRRCRVRPAFPDRQTRAGPPRLCCSR